MPAGRPTKYTPELIEQTLEYIENYEEHDDVIPSIAGLSCVVDVSRSTLHDWATHDDKKEFSDILQKLLSKQEKILFNKGLSGDFNANITKLALGKHGYTDKQDVTSGDKPIQNTWSVYPVTVDRDG